MAEPDDRSQGLLAWQWALYPDGHTTRANLLIHVVTVPLFAAGTVALLASSILGARYALTGLTLMVGTMAAQGRGHAGEPQRPVRFRGPVDVITRIMVEQWITFPRYLVSGAFARAWSAASR